MKTTDSVMREIKDICTYHGDEGTSGYCLSNEQFGKLEALYSHSLAEAEKKAYKKGWADAEKNLAKIMGVANKMIDGLKNYRPLTGDNPEESYDQPNN